MMMVMAVDISEEEVGSPATWDSTTVHEAIGRKCLVVSGDGLFRSRAEASADLSGCVVCETPSDAAALSRTVDRDFDIVVVDIAHPLGDRVSDAVEIAEEFAIRGSNLFVFCGSDGSMEEELWARQLGAWVFMPGEWPLTLSGAL